MSDILHRAALTTVEVVRKGTEISMPKIEEWLFRAKNMKWEAGYLDEEGRLVEKKDAEPWKGTRSEADDEAHRRALLYEKAGRGIVWRLAPERA